MSRKAGDLRRRTAALGTRSGDFRGAHELTRRTEDARQNADTVDQSIAKLIDSIKELNRCLAWRISRAA
jgi:hypothetical protein